MDILTLLASWGSRAAPAVPQIICMLPYAKFAAEVLAAIQDVGQSTTANITIMADSNNDDLWARVVAANALHKLSGQTEPLLAAIKTPCVRITILRRGTSKIAGCPGLADHRRAAAMAGACLGGNSSSRRSLSPISG